jgi:hypothetical protein
LTKDLDAISQFRRKIGSAALKDLAGDKRAPRSGAPDSP